jgi:hypothetical protein
MRTESFDKETTRVHFKNAAARAKFESGKLTPAEARQAVVEVPIRRGMDRKALKQLRNDMMYAAKLNSPEWKAEAARRKGLA